MHYLLSYVILKPIPRARQYDLHPGCQFRRFDIVSEHSQARADLMQQAVHICFKNFDQLYGGTYDAHNLLLSLAPLYQASSEGSPLRVATHAAALCAISQTPSKRSLQPEAARTYCKAVRTMAAALKYPEVAQSNETLLATLLLSWYEVC